MSSRRKRAPGKQHTAGRRYGLNPANFAKSVQWMADCDYADKLPDYAKDFLSQFLDEYINAAFTGDRAIHDTDELRKDCYRRKNYANRDALTLARLGNLTATADELPSPSEAEGEPTDEYLSSPDYLAALHDYRAHLGRNDSSRPVTTPQAHDARLRLEKTKTNEEK